MLRFTLLLLCFVAIVTSAIAQTTGTLTGRVYDDEGKPLIGARIVLLGTTQGGLSKAPDGKFTIAGVRTGDYKVEIAAIGFAPHKCDVHISIGQITDIGTIKLAAQALSTNAIIVRSHKDVERESVAKTNTIARESIERSARTNIIDAVGLQAANG